MSNYNQSHAQGAYPPTSYPAPSVEGYGQPAGAYMVPPPAGYPMKDDGQQGRLGTDGPATTQSRGEGFWKGCCAALCCCCVLDACF